MRFKLVLEEAGGRKAEFLINKDYRSRFISLVKKVFEQDSAYSLLYENQSSAHPKRKPFTFSVYLGKGFRVMEASDYILTTPPFELLFSTGDPKVATYFYNGVLALLADGSYTLNLSSIAKGEPLYLRIKDIKLVREEVIKSGAVLFKAKQPVIITHPHRRREDDDYFLTPGMDQWEEVLSRRLLEDYRRVTGEKIEGQVRFRKVENPLALEVLVQWGKLDRSFVKEPIKTTRIKHYGGYLRGFKGIFLLCGPVRLLRFVYQYGMGIRTGQGFGYLDVLAQLNKEEIYQSGK